MPTDQVRGLKAHGPSPAKAMRGHAEIRAALTEVLAKGNQPPAAALTRRVREPVAAK
jgi:hypothetical protein